MKQLIIVIPLMLVSLYVTLAIANDNVPRTVQTIHQRISAVPSSRKGPSKALENNKIPTIERTIATLLRFRRDSSNVIRKSETAYPKHHLLQPIETPLDETHPKQDLNSTTAPYTDYHHTWKKVPVILQ